METTRHEDHQQRVVRLGAIAFDVANGLLREHMREIYLTPIEAQILNILLINHGRYVSQRMLLEDVWHGMYAPHYIRIYIRRLRRKLQRLGASTLTLEAARGIGYRVIVDMTYQGMDSAGCNGEVQASKQHSE
jgi:two-component system KDP operon response regulator KdpE